MQNNLARRMFSVFGFFAIVAILFSTPTEVKAESALSKVYTTYIIEPGAFVIETLNEMFSTLTGGSVNLLANTSSSTESSNIIDDYIIEPLGSLLYSIFDFSVDVEVTNPAPVTNVTYTPPEPSEPIPTPVVTPEPTPVTTTPPVVNYYTTETTGTGARGATGERGPAGPQGPRGERGPAGSDAVVDTSNFVNSSFFDNQVDGILGSIEDGISGLGSSLAQEFNTGLLDVSGSVTIGSALAGTDKALVVNNNTSTGNIFEAQDGGTAVFTIADGGNVGVGTSSPIAQLHVAGKVPTAATGSVSTGTAPERLFVQGNYAYVTNQTSATFQIFDVSNPVTPVLISTLSIGANPRASYVQGKYAYVTSLTSATLQIIDISNPTNPVIVGSVATTLNYDVYVQGRYAYLVGNNGLEIIDVANPTSPVRVGVVTGFSNPRQLYVRGTYAYVTNSGNGTLAVVDISNPVAPSIVGSTATGTGPQGISVQGRYAYVANFNSNTLQIFDISNPVAPTSIGSVATSARPYRISVQGRYLYVNEDTSGALHIFDISDPTTPTSVGSITAVGGQAYDVVVQGRYSYTISRTTNTLQIFDVGSAYVQQLETGGIESGTLTLRNNLQVGNDADISGGLVVARGAQISGPLSAIGNLSVTQITAATGALKGIVYTGAVNTNQTASTEIPSLTLTTAGREWATGALATQREVLITQPTYSFVGASTITDAATVGIAGAPIKSTNASITNTHGLLIQAGAVSTATNSYGLTVNAQTGATNNYAAQFMGGNVGVGTSAPSEKIEIQVDSATTANMLSLYNNGASSTQESRLVWKHGSSRNLTGAIGSRPGAGYNSGDLRFLTGSSGVLNERMVIHTAGNVGIGTSTLGAQLEILSDEGNGGGAAINVTNSVGGGLLGTEFAVLADRNSQWNALYAKGGAGVAFYSDGEVNLMNGSIGIGTTAPDKALEINSATGANLRLTYNDSNGTAANYADLSTSSIGGLTITSAGTNPKTLVVNNNSITSTGNIFEAQDNGTAVFTVADGGTVHTPSTYTGTSSSNVYGFRAGSTFGSLYMQGNTNNNAGATILHNAYAYDANPGYKSAETHSIVGTRGIIFSLGSTGGMSFVADANATTANVAVTPTQRMFVGNNGNIAIGPDAASDLLHLTTGNLRIGASAAVRSGTAGTNQLILFNGTLPAGTLTNGVSLYSDTGELRVMDAAGNNTLLSPHEDVNNYWVFDSTNSETGKSLIIDMEEMMKKLNNTFGWDFVHETIDGVATLPEDNVPLVLPDTFFEAVTGRLVAWFADASNGITDMFAVTYHAKEEICINETCINEDELKALLENAGVNNNEPDPLVPSEPVEGEPVPEEEIIPTPEEVPTDPEPEIIPEPEPLVPSEPVEGEPVLEPIP